MNARPLACPILVGRDRELAILHEAKRGLAQSRAAFVLIAGEAGIGKSRLLEHFFRGTANERARNLVSVDCLEYASAPFGPIREMLVGLARSVPQPLSPLLAHFVARNGASERIEKTELFLAVVEFLRDCAQRRATIVTIEDVHWADAMTLDFLTYAASRLVGTRTLIVVTYRSTERDQPALAAAIARLMREPITFRIELDGLARADVRALILRALDTHDALPQATIESVASRAEGNPFFAEELLKDAVGRRGAREVGSLPISIRASIVARLRSFAPAERAVIDQAAVLGLRFDPYVLARTLRTDVDAIVPALRKARDANLIAEEDDGRIRFRFRHALTRQAVYDELLLFDARRTHRTILEALESFDEETQHLEELAYHAWEARDPVKTLRYNERAADAALALQSLPEAQVGYQRAFDAATERRDQARLLERLCRVSSLRGDLARAIELYDAACAAAIEVGDFDAAARLTRWTAADRNNAGDASGVAFGLAFLERYGDRASVGERDALLAMLARLCTITYDTERAVELLARIAAPEALPPTAQQNVLAVRFDIAWIEGDVAAWMRAAEESLDLLPRLTPFLALTVCYSIAEGASFLAHDEITARALAFADRVVDRYDFSGISSYGAAIRALDFYVRGKLAEARTAIRAALAMPDVHVATALLALVAPFVADALDDDTVVAPEIEAQFAHVRAHAQHADDGAILGASAVWSLRNGQHARAVNDLRRALACMPRAIVHLAPVAMLAAQHFPVAELDRLDRFTDPDAGAPDDVLARANALAIGAIVARRRDEPTLAAACGTQAAETYARLGRPLFAARAFESAGDLHAARALYERCGATAWAERLRDRPVPTATPEDLLSDRQRDVARLLADGLNNVAIGERLSISTKTVEKHVASIYDKLGVRTRPQVARLIAQSTDARSEIAL